MVWPEKSNQCGPCRGVLIWPQLLIEGGRGWASIIVLIPGFEGGSYQVCVVQPSPLLPPPTTYTFIQPPLLPQPTTPYVYVLPHPPACHDTRHYLTWVLGFEQSF